MIAKQVVAIEVQLTLTEKEAAWLRAALQNPISPDESAEDAKMRERFFLALPEAKL